MSENSRQSETANNLKGYYKQTGSNTYKEDLNNLKAYEDIKNGMYYPKYSNKNTNNKRTFKKKAVAGVIAGLVALSGTVFTSLYSPKTLMAKNNDIINMELNGNTENGMEKISDYGLLNSLKASSPEEKEMFLEIAIALPYLNILKDDEKTDIAINILNKYEKQLLDYAQNTISKKINEVKNDNSKYTLSSIRHYGADNINHSISTDEDLVFTGNQIPGIIIDIMEKRFEFLILNDDVDPKTKALLVQDLFYKLKSFEQVNLMLKGNKLVVNKELENQKVGYTELDSKERYQVLKQNALTSKNIENEISMKEAYEKILKEKETETEKEIEIENLKQNDLENNLEIE